jgi:hypothetical protein
MRMSASVKAAAAMLGAVAVATLAIKGFSVASLANFRPTPVAPGEFAILAFAPGAGYRIVVSNGIAHLVEVRDGGDGGFEAPTDDQREVESAPRLPMRETLRALDGDTEALGKMVMSVNRLSSDDLPVDPVVWKSEDIEQAIEGDLALRRRLEADLLTTLDGLPLAVISRKALNTGIVVDSPVEVAFTVLGERRSMVCRIQQPFVTRFVDAVQSRLREKFDQSESLIAGIYREEARRIEANPAEAEDVARSLRARYDPARLAGFAEKPSRVLSACTVLVNDTHVERADSACREGANGRDDCTITLRMTEDGRMRLWKYSHDHPGFQLLVAVRGVAVAAPRIRTELAAREVKLTQLPSKSLVQETVSLINEVVRARSDA